MSLEDAVNQMELVGHDFFLFHDADTDRPSVVYRRRGWSYGVLHLETDARRRSRPGSARLPVEPSGASPPRADPRGCAATASGRTGNARATCRRGVRTGWRREPATADVIRVLIVDDHALYRRGLQTVLETEDGIEVVGEAADGIEAVDQAEEIAARRHRHGRRHAQARWHRGLPGHQAARALGPHPHADELRRRGQPLRGGAGRRQRLPPQGRAVPRRSPPASAASTTASRCSRR